MVKSIRFVIFLACLFNAGSAFAQGGACPASVNYSNPVPGIQLSLTSPAISLSSLGVTNCFFVAASGSDSNSGTSESSPWLHAPGMPNCTANCAANAPSGGTGYIFRGGDTWHLGNSGASPYTGGTWNWSANGSSANPIYVGVDPNWYSGSGWARPILNADNPVSTSTALGACGYQVPGSNDMMSLGGSSYIIIDNFEWLGLCTNGTASETFGSDAYLEAGSSTNVLVEHNYFHGWTHRQFSYPTYQYACMVILGGSTGDNYQYNVVDGSDSDPAGCGAFYDALNEASYNVFNAASQGIGNPCHIFHDNIMSNWADPGDGNAHGNVFECVGEGGGTNVYYNNVFFNLYQSGVQGAIFWIGPPSGATDYFFNNLIYNTPSTGNYFNVQNKSGGTVYAFNSTLESDGSGPGLMDCEGGSLTTAANMDFIGNTSPFYGGGTCNTATNVARTVATANSQGYTNSETYAYSPTNSSAATVGAGTNVRNTYCNALLGSGDPLIQAAGTACQSDTSYSCSYDSTHHAVVCPERSRFARPGTGSAWSVGAYEPGLSPKAPSGLTATANSN